MTITESNPEYTNEFEEAFRCLQLIQLGKQFGGRIAEMAINIAEKRPDWFTVYDITNYNGRIMSREIGYTDEFMSAIQDNI